MRQTDFSYDENTIQSDLVSGNVSEQFRGVVIKRCYHPDFA